MVLHFTGMRDSGYHRLAFTSLCVYYYNSTSIPSIRIVPIFFKSGFTTETVYFRGNSSRSVNHFLFCICCYKTWKKSKPTCIFQNIKKEERQIEKIHHLSLIYKVNKTSKYKAMSLKVRNTAVWRIRDILFAQYSEEHVLSTVLKLFYISRELSNEN